MSEAHRAKIKTIFFVSLFVGWVVFCGAMACDTPFWRSMFYASIVCGLLGAWLFGELPDEGTAKNEKTES